MSMIDNNDDDLNLSPDLLDMAGRLFGDDETKQVTEDTTTSEEVVVENEESTVDEGGEEVYELDMAMPIPLTIGEENVEVPLEELTRVYVNNKDYDAKFKQLTDYADGVLQKEREALAALELAKLESDIILKDAESIRWDTLTPEEFKDMTLRKQNLLEKSASIKAQIERIRPHVEAVDSDKVKYEIARARDTLVRDVPGFNDEMYGSALTHAVNVLGVDKDFAINCRDPGIIKAFINANENYVNPVKTKKVTMPKKVAKVTAPVTKQLNLSKQEDLLTLAERLF